MFIAFGQTLCAQQELLLATQPDLVHSNSINPAFWPKGKRIVVGLPALSAHGWHNNRVTLGDLFAQNGRTTTLRLPHLISQIEDQNELNVQLRVETVSVGVPIAPRIRLLAHHAVRSQAAVQYNKSLVQLLGQGNAQFIGQTVQINPVLDFSVWSEWAIGGQYHTDKLKIGARVKYLTGMRMLKTQAFESSIYTNPDVYQLQLESNIKILSAGVINSIDTSRNGYDVSLNELKKNPLITENTGLGIDLGFTYELMENLKIGASVTDLAASIKWKKDLKEYTSDGKQAYNGAIFDGNTFFGTGNQVDFQSGIDSLKEAFQFKTTTGGTYTQKITARYNVHVNYSLLSKFYFGFAASTSQTSLKQNDWGTGISAAVKLARWVKLGTMLSTKDHAPVQIGSLVDLRFGPTRLYFVADNLISVFGPSKQPNIHFRLGAGLII
jgi:Family of unknown function (DUF5723)